MAVLALAVLLLPCCSCENDSEARPPARRPVARRPRRPRRRRRENRLAFEAKTLAGWTFGFTERNAHRRVVVFLTDLTSRWAERCSRVAQRLHNQRHRYNLDLIAVVLPPGYQPNRARRVPADRPDRAGLAALARKHRSQVGATFPMVLDPDGEIAELYVKAFGRHKLDALPAFYMFPPQAEQPMGRAIFAYYARRSSEPEGYLHRRVLKQFGLEADADVSPLAGHRPQAPDVAFTDHTGATHRLSDYRGRLLFFVFIIRHCPRCKAELDFLGKMLATYGRQARQEEPWLEVVAVCTDAEGEELRRFVQERGYDFPVASDPEWALRSAFRYRGATPDTFVIAPDGRIHFRHMGHKPDLNSVLHMEIRTLLGIPTRPLLQRGEYAGVRACRVCHHKEYVDWTLTRHACAWETLVRIGREDDPECIRCHVVAYRQAGGFRSDRYTPHLQDVQCESCHGKNGCLDFHHDPDRVPVKKSACLKCHDEKHSPRFHYPSARPKVLHTQADELARLPRAEREARLEKLCSGTDRQLFDPQGTYVGDAVCGKCHPTAYKALADGHHAKAIRLLAEPAPDRWDVPRHKRGVVGLRKPECLRCHTTGFGKPGGFPEEPPANPDEHTMAGVGCEMCHGPGKAHAEDPKKPRAIARLGGTCNECNILPICRQCHDSRNDPDFDYRTALPKARHPTGEAKTP
jgi:peroxiredoxin